MTWPCVLLKTTLPWTLVKLLGEQVTLPQPMAQEPGPRYYLKSFDLDIVVGPRSWTLAELPGPGFWSNDLVMNIDQGIWLWTLVQEYLAPDMGQDMWSLVVR